MVQKIKRKLSCQKIGHTGTLDKFARGLMVIPVGKATAFSQLFLEYDKSYLARICLGVRTDSGDPNGEILEDVPESERLRVWQEDWSDGQKLRQEILGLPDWTTQVAPAVSALKFQGKRLSDWHRAGVEVPPKIRAIRISDVEIREFQYPQVRVSLRVSSGTYIRKIASDLGERLGFPLSLGDLERTSVHQWTIDQAKTAGELEWEDIHPILDFVPFARVGVSGQDACRLAEPDPQNAIAHGRTFRLVGQDSFERLTVGEDFFLVGQDGAGFPQAWAWAQKKNLTDWTYTRVLV